ncbi:MAG TPA: hypothetical protein DER23_01675, partial [Clostridiales bacterium]|nr:hypothetical protein [Clostridiales bacterium]
HYPLLFRYLKKAGKPVVYNLHDCWILTGKCAHYTVRGCYKWKETCYRCPKEVVHQYPHSYFFDFTRKMHREKKAWLAGIPNLTVVGVSDWTADQARQSYLKDRRIERIYNWINLQVFYPREENVLARFGADPEKFTVICVSVSWAEGSVRYEYLKQLIQRVDENTQFIVVGQCDRPIKSEKVFHVAYVSDTGLLAKLYSSAHVYVHFSLEDTFGKVIAEAMACGTPAVVFRSTGCPELVAKGGGYAADPGDMDQVYKYVQEIFKNGKDYYRDACVKTTRESFSYETNVGQLMGLYEDILNKAQQESYP